jgi:hypothetical protein
VSIAALILERLEVPLFRRIWFDALILAILLGAVGRRFGLPGQTPVRWDQLQRQDAAGSGHPAG